MPVCIKAARRRSRPAAFGQEAMSPEDIDKVVRVTLDLRRRQERHSLEALATSRFCVWLILIARRVPYPPGGRQANTPSRLDTGVLFTSIWLSTCMASSSDCRRCSRFPACHRDRHEELDFVRLLQRIGQKTGGISRQLLFSARRGQPRRLPAVPRQGDERAAGRSAGTDQCHAD